MPKIGIWIAIYTKLETVGISPSGYNKLDTTRTFTLMCTSLMEQIINMTSTYGYVATGGYSPAISSWLSTSFQPEVDQALSAMGMFRDLLLFAANGDDFSGGNIAFLLQPRFSHTYGDIRTHGFHFLIEKSLFETFEQASFRYFMWFLEQASIPLGDHFEGLRRAVKFSTPINRKEYSG